MVKAFSSLGNRYGANMILIKHRWLSFDTHGLSLVLIQSLSSVSCREAREVVNFDGVIGHK